MKIDEEKILNKKFESVINGYSPTKVDQFLDEIIHEFIAMKKTINELKAKIKELEDKNEMQSRTIELRDIEIDSLKRNSE